MGFALNNPLPDVIAKVRAAQGKLQGDTQNLLQILGTQALSLERLNYRKKARRDVGDDGVRWNEITDSALASRLRKRSAWKNITRDLEALSKEQKALKGPGKAKRLAAIRKRRASLRERRKRLIAKERSNHEIGVDTGLQRASSSPGFNASDGKGGNLFRFEGTAVVIGYNRQYSPHFDKLRPLMPQSLPTTWREALEKRIAVWADKLTNEVTKGLK